MGNGGGAGNWLCEKWEKILLLLPSFLGRRGREGRNILRVDCFYFSLYHRSEEKEREKGKVFFSQR